MGSSGEGGSPSTSNGARVWANQKSNKATTMTGIYNSIEKQCNPMVNFECSKCAGLVAYRLR